MFTMDTKKNDGSCLIKLTNSKQLTQFLHECVDEIAGRKQSSDDHFSTTSDIAWTPQEFETARKLIQTLYTENVHAENFLPELAELSLSDNQEIKDCFNIRKREIVQAVIKNSLLKSELPLVENFDWKLKWILGSSKLASINEALVQMDLHCIQNQGGDSKAGRKTVNFEMNLQQVESLIIELEKAKNELSKTS